MHGTCVNYSCDPHGTQPLTVMPSAAAWRHRCTPTGGVETAVAVGAPSRADGSFGAWLRPWPFRAHLLWPVTVVVCMIVIPLRCV